jgi:hypothetical protein
MKTIGRKILALMLAFALVAGIPTFVLADTWANAYASELKNAESEIKYTETISGKEYTNAGRIAIADICGDNTPELLYLKIVDTQISESGLNLYIYAYDSGNTKLLLETRFDYFEYRDDTLGLFTTENSKLYAYRQYGGGTAQYYTLTQYTLQSGVLAKTDVIERMEDISWNSSGAWWARNDKPISQSEYERLYNDAIGNMDTVLIKDFNNRKAIVQTYDEALAYLRSAISITAKPTSSPVLVNGTQTSFDAYNIADNNYFKLRDLAFVLSGTPKQFEVGYDNATKAITLTSGQSYTAEGGEMEGSGAGNKAATPTSSKIYLDGAEISLTAYNIGGYNYFKLRDIGQAFDFGVDWDGASQTIAIDTGKGYTPG